MNSVVGTHHTAKPSQRKSDGQLRVNFPKISTTIG